jgi:hypothetical protein
MLTLVPFAIDTVIPFLAMLFLGRRFDMSIDFRRVFVALLVGTAAGMFGFLLAVVITLSESEHSRESVFTGDLMFDGSGPSD